MGELEIVRRSGGFGVFRALHIDVDGVPRIKLGRDDSQRIEVPAGTRSVVARMDWARSPALEVVCRDGETARVEARSAGFLRALVRSFLSPGTVFELHEVGSTSGHDVGGPH